MKPQEPTRIKQLVTITHTDGTNTSREYKEGEEYDLPPRQAKLWIKLKLAEAVV